MGERTYADGGSATSQAIDRDEEAWKPRPIVSLLIKALTVIAPVIGSFAMGRVYSLAITPDLFGTYAYWGGLLTLSIMTALAVEREAQALLPVAALFKMSLVFPDRAPSRFGVALREGTTKRLTARALESGDDAAAADLLVLVKELSKHDPLTRGHSERVRAYSDLIAEELGLSRTERNKLAWGALAHDVGKLEVRSTTLNKPERPNDDEWAEIRNHPAAAIPLMADLEPWLGEWTLAASQHHERYDGKGYPFGLAGDEISLPGRIVAVADAYDCMTSTRSYKKALSPEAAREELINNAGTQFDPDVVRAFLNVGLRRMKLAGPLAWLGELAWFARIPQAVSTVGSTTVTTVATAAVAVGTAVTAGTVEPPEPTEIAAIERTVEDIVLPSLDAGDVGPEAPQLLAPGAQVTPAPGNNDARDGGSARTVTPESTVAPEPSTEPPVSTTTVAEAAVEPARNDEPSATTTTAPVVTTTIVTTTTAPTTTAPTTTAPTTTAPPVAQEAPPEPPAIAPVELTDPVTLGAASGGDHHRLPLDGTLAIGGDGPSVVLDQASTLDAARADNHAHVHFQMSNDRGILLSGDTALTIWLAMDSFNTNLSGGVHLELFDCATPFSSCTELASGGHRFEQATFGNGFGQVEISLGELQHRIGAGRYLVLDINVDPTSDGDVWLGFGTTSFPATFHIG
ncbi:MAG: HD-GYP domain-containing protein [Actinomycetota bacterium]